MAKKRERESEEDTQMPKNRGPVTAAMNNETNAAYLQQSNSSKEMNSFLTFRIIVLSKNPQITANHCATG